MFTGRKAEQPASTTGLLASIWIWLVVTGQRKLRILVVWVWHFKDTVNSSGVRQSKINKMLLGITGSKRLRPSKKCCVHVRNYSSPSLLAIKSELLLHKYKWNKYVLKRYALQLKHTIPIGFFVRGKERLTKKLTLNLKCYQGKP